MPATPPHSLPFSECRGGGTTQSMPSSTWYPPLLTVTVINTTAKATWRGRLILAYSSSRFIMKKQRPGGKHCRGIGMSSSPAFFPWPAQFAFLHLLGPCCPGVAPPTVGRTHQIRESKTMPPTSMPTDPSAGGISSAEVPSPQMSLAGVQLIKANPSVSPSSSVLSTAAFRDRLLTLAAVC